MKTCNEPATIATTTTTKTKAPRLRTSIQAGEVGAVQAAYRANDEYGGGMGTAWMGSLYASRLY